MTKSWVRTLSPFWQLIRQPLSGCLNEVSLSFNMPRQHDQIFPEHRRQYVWLARPRCFLSWLTAIASA